MNEQLVEQICSEMRSEYQIPPYYPEESLKRLVKQGYAALDELNPGWNPSEDVVGYELLKNRIYYDFHHIVNQFEQDFESSILRWQLLTEAEE